MDQEGRVDYKSVSELFKKVFNLVDKIECVDEREKNYIKTRDLWKKVVEKIHSMNQSNERMIELRSQLITSIQSKKSFSKSSINNLQTSCFIDDATWDKHVCKSRSSSKSEENSEVIKLIPLSECRNEDFIVSAGYGTGVYADKETIKKGRNIGDRRKEASYIIGDDGKEKIHEFKEVFQSVPKSKFMNKEVKVEVHEDEIKDTIDQKDKQIYEDLVMFDDAVEEMNMEYFGAEEEMLDEGNGIGEVLDKIKQEYEGVLRKMMETGKECFINLEKNFNSKSGEEDMEIEVEATRKKVKFSEVVEVFDLNEEEFDEEVLLGEDYFEEMEKLKYEEEQSKRTRIKKQKESFSILEGSFNSKSGYEEMKIEVEPVEQSYNSNVEINGIETQIQVGQKTKKKVSFSGVVEVLNSDEELYEEEYEDSIEDVLESTEEGYISILETDTLKHSNITNEEMLDDVGVLDFIDEIAENSVVNVDEERVIIEDALNKVVFVKENEAELIGDSFERIEKEHNIKKKREIDKQLNQLLLILPIQAKSKINLFKFLFKNNYQSKFSKVFMKKVLSLNSVVLFDKFNKWFRKRRLKSAHNNLFLKSTKGYKVRVANNGESMWSVEKGYTGRKRKEIDKYSYKSFSIHSIKVRLKSILQTYNFRNKQQLRFKIVYKFFKNYIKSQTKKLCYMLPDVIGKVEKWSRKVRLKWLENGFYFVFTRCEI